jgi:hypothetical protein
VEDHFETFVQVYEERFERPYGFWRPYLQKVIDRYLECGDLHHGFPESDVSNEVMNIFWPLLKRSGNPALAGQAPSFLSLLPSEAGGGIRRMALFPCAQEGSPPTCRLQHPEDPTPGLPQGFLSIIVDSPRLTDVKRCNLQTRPSLKPYGWANPNFCILDFGLSINLAF